MQFSSMSSLGSSMRRWKSSMFSNTTARARWCMSLGVAAEGLMMAPSGQRLPRSTAMPASFLNGDFKLWITSRFQHAAAEPVEVVEVQLDADAAREGGQMDHRVCRSADRRQGADCVLECVPGEDPGEGNLLF